MDNYKQTLDVLLVLVSITSSLVIIGFIQLNILKEKFDTLTEEILESKFEYICMYQNPAHKNPWFTIGKSYKSMDGKIKDDQGVDWIIELHKRKNKTYRIDDYFFKRVLK